MSLRTLSRTLPLVFHTAVVALVLAATAVAAAPPGPMDLAIVDAKVVDGTGAPPRPSATVLVRGGRIVAVGSSAAVAIPPGTEVFDAGGRTLLPGFVDTHAHLTLGPVSMKVVDGQPKLSAEPLEGGPQRSLTLLLAHGVTTVRDPGGRTEEAVAMRERLERGELVGPRAVVAGLVIDTSRFEGLVEQVATPEEIREAVRRQVEQGVDLVKLYTGLDPELLEAGIDEAHRHEVPVVGHLEATTWGDAAELGIDGIVHVIPGSAELLPEETREAYRGKPGGLAFPAWFRWVELDSPEIRATIRTLALEGVHLDPTLVVFEHAFFGDVPRFAEDSPWLELAHPDLVTNWKELFTFNIGWTDDDFAVAHQVWPKVLSFVRRLWEGGVTLSAGTDANNPWVVPGVSFHRELELLAMAGIAPAEVLKIATRNGAAVAGVLDETGTIEPGKSADLVLVEGDPLADISAVRDIVWVMKDGRRYDPRDLLATVDR